jgi:serine/threonine-protein kinase HipA
MTQDLDVYLNGKPAGVIEARRDAKLCFRYTADYLASVKPIPLFPPFPLQQEAFGPALTLSMFEGLLPGNDIVRRELERTYNLAKNDVWGLLGAVGRDCAGALSIVQKDAVPPPAIGTVNDPVDRLTADRLAKDIEDLTNKPLGFNNDMRRRMSNAGYQAKMAVRVDGNGNILVPLDGLPSTYILKPEPIQWPGLVINEHFCMSLLRAMGLNVAKTIAAQVEAKPYLLIERFDRVIDNDSDEISRLHQYDFCQSLGLHPDKKYQKDGGPAAADCVKLMSYSVEPFFDQAAFLQALVCNVLLGNCDAHGKNYSFLVTNDGPRFAPLYDIVSTKIYPIADDLAMHIGDVQIVDRVRWRHWKKLADICDINFEVISLIVNDIAELMLEQLPIVQGHFRASGMAMEQPERIAAFARSQIAHVLDEAA